MIVFQVKNCKILAQIATVLVMIYKFLVLIIIFQARFQACSQILFTTIDKTTNIRLLISENLSFTPFLINYNIGNSDNKTKTSKSFLKEFVNFFISQIITFFLYLNSYPQITGKMFV